jgi:hypothetical protein
MNILDRKLAQEVVNIKKDSDYNLASTAHRVYGFLPNHEISFWANRTHLLGEMKPFHYFSRPNQMSYHNLCQDAKTPSGIASLLGMGLQFCIESARPNQRIEEGILRFQRSVRLHFYFAEQDGKPGEADKPDPDNVNYIPGLYLPSTWSPPPAKESVELALANFDAKLNDFARALPKQRRHNLSPSQRNVIRELRDRPDLIVFQTDKNLGPSVSERKRYIQDVLANHLLNDSNYEHLPPDIAQIEIKRQRCAFEGIYGKFGHLLPTEAEETYFKRAMTEEHLSQTRVPQIYGIYKVHKEVKKTRPVISSVNSLPELFSKHVDYWLKKVVGELLPTYIKDAEHLMRSLNETFPNGLPPGAKLFSVDAVGMYSNIDTDHGVDVMTRWLTQHNETLPASMPIDFILASLEEIMRNNIFQFGNTYWRQIRGCAMGTSSAVNYACLYVGLLEVRRLLPRYKNNLLFFKRFIDDGIGVWIDTPDEPLAWQSFLNCLNNWGTLKWTCDGHVDDLIFLDLRISITPLRQIHYKTYQKEQNLYLYIPPTSAHPKNMLFGLVYGRLRAYRLQNTSDADYIKMAVLLARRLCARGYSLTMLMPAFQKASNRLTKSDPRHRLLPQNEPNPDDTKSQNPLIFHLKHHPRGVTRQQVRTAYSEFMEPIISDRNLIIAVSRPKNIKDRVCHTQLPDIPGENPSDFIPTGDDTVSP